MIDQKNKITKTYFTRNISTKYKQYEEDKAANRSWTIKKVQWFYKQEINTLDHLNILSNHADLTKEIAMFLVVSYTYQTSDEEFEGQSSHLQHNQHWKPKDGEHQLHKQVHSAAQGTKPSQTTKETRKFPKASFSFKTNLCVFSSTNNNFWIHNVTKGFAHFQALLIKHKTMCYNTWIRSLTWKSMGTLYIIHLILANIPPKIAK